MGYIRYPTQLTLLSPLTLTPGVRFMVQHMHIATNLYDLVEPNLRPRQPSIVAYMHVCIWLWHQSAFKLSIHTIPPMVLSTWKPYLPFGLRLRCICASCAPISSAFSGDALPPMFKCSKIAKQPNRRPENKYGGRWGRHQIEETGGGGGLPA